MEHQRHRNPPPAQLAVPDSASADRAHWTPAKQRIFLTALLETGSVTSAARAAGMNRSSAQRLRRRLAGTPFDRNWAHALRFHAEQLADPFGTLQPAASPPPCGRVPAASGGRG